MTQANAILYIAPLTVTRKGRTERYSLPDGLYLGPRAEGHVDTYQAMRAWWQRHPDHQGPVDAYVLPADSEFVPASEDLPDGFEAHPVTVSGEALIALHGLIYTNPGGGGVPSPVHNAYGNAVAMLQEADRLPGPVVDRLIRAAARCGHIPEEKAKQHLAVVIGNETVSQALAATLDGVTRADIDALAVMAMPTAGAVTGAIEQFEALADLHIYSAVTAERRDRVAAAWRSGIRNVRRIALAGGISRSTVYADLVASGINPTDR